MSEFQRLFALPSSEIKPLCIITPFLSKEITDELHVPKLSKGVLYSSGTGDKFSLITSHMGAGFVGDAVLHLKNTDCKQIIFFGSCGMIQDNPDLKIGDVIMIDKAYNQDSFIQMLSNNPPTDIYYPDKNLADKFSSLNKASCLTVNSLKLEQEYIKHLTTKIDVIDMETAAVYAAAQHVGMKSIAVLFITDILGKVPYYDQTNFKQVMRQSAQTLSNMLNKG
jgi:purine-nucleoside phosphorylase